MNKCKCNNLSTTQNPSNHLSNDLANTLATTYQPPKTLTTTQQFKLQRGGKFLANF